MKTDMYDFGQRVFVHTFRGLSVQRIVLHDFGDAVLICRGRELELAEAEGRPPVGITFPKEFVFDLSNSV